MFLAVFVKKLIPNDIAVVKIDIKMIIPYTFFIYGDILFIAYTAGISNSFIFTSIFIKNKNIIVIKIVVTIDDIIAINLIFLSLVIYSFIEIKTGINKTLL